MDEAVLIDSRVAPPPIWKDGKKFDWNFRVLVARNDKDEGEVTGAIGRVGGW